MSDKKTFSAHDLEISETLGRVEQRIGDLDGKMCTFFANLTDQLSKCQVSHCRVHDELWKKSSAHDRVINRLIGGLLALQVLWGAVLVWIKH